MPLSPTFGGLASTTVNRGLPCRAPPAIQLGRRTRHFPTSQPPIKNGCEPALKAPKTAETCMPSGWSKIKNSFGVRWAPMEPFSSRPSAWPRRMRCSLRCRFFWLLVARPIGPLLFGGIRSLCKAIEGVLQSLRPCSTSKPGETVGGFMWLAKGSWHMAQRVRQHLRFLAPTSHQGSMKGYGFWNQNLKCWVLGPSG